MTKREVTQVSYEITGFAIKVHKELGPGLLESVYEKCLKYELVQNGYYESTSRKIDTLTKLDFLIVQNKNLLNLNP